MLITPQGQNTGGGLIPWRNYRKQPLIQSSFGGFFSKRIAYRHKKGIIHLFYPLSMEKVIA